MPRLHSEEKVLRTLEPYFDAEHYRKQVPGLAGHNDRSLLQHYCNCGWERNLDPTPDFSTERYLAAHPSIRQRQINPFYHYITTGRARGLDPRPPTPDERDAEIIAPFFDASFYRAVCPDLANFSDSRLLTHFNRHGWKEGRDPSPEFCVRRYLEAYADVALAEMNPLLHYLQSGRAEGRTSRPACGLDAEMEATRPYFHADYYRITHPSLTDVSDDRLLEIFLTRGWKHRRDPSPDFSVSGYLKLHPDVRLAEINPLLHYATSGKMQERETVRPFPVRLQDMTADEEAILAGGFDPDYYRAQVSGLPEDDREALRHYVDKGWHKGFDPAPDFSTEFYLRTYTPDSVICPLADYRLVPHKPPRRAAEGQPARFVHRPRAEMTGLRGMQSVLDARDASHMEQPAPPAMIDARALDLHWIVPDFSPGSGGHMTIFRIVRLLENFGHRCTIWIERPTQHDTTDAAYETLVKYFQCVQAEVRLVRDGLFEVRGDAVIATGWSTAHLADASRGFAAKYYFVQDHEPDFYPAGSERILAQQTYAFDLACICASPWLETIMRERYGRWSRGFHLAYDPEIYRRREVPASRTGRLKIAVYGREHTARRCVQLCLLGLDILGARRDDFEVHFFGQAEMPFDETPFEAYNHGVLSAEELARLYGDCDLGLCVSATNYSLVPQEMMACGLPVVELDGESTRAIFPEGVVTLAAPTPDGIADALGSLLDDPAARASQRDRAADWVGPMTWETTAREVEGALLERLRETGVEIAAPAIVPTPAPILDVVIPTYNGMGEIEEVIASLREQRLADRIQIHCIDSSSSDGTTEWLHAQEDVSTTVIAQKDFQHGRTRNFGASLGSAPLIAFLTQDAIPATRDWATDIAKMMAHYPEAAGLFGRHLPHPHHPLFVRREIERHFENMRSRPLAVSKETDPLRWNTGEIAWRQALYFYSDNNSAMRRDVWREIPYPEIDYGEDQVWASMILEAGYTKLYAPTATVYHSHDYDADETFKRSKIESAFFFEQFGWELGTGTEEELELRIDREQTAFLKWAAKNGVDAAEIDRRHGAIAAKHRGWRAGLYSARAIAEGHEADLPSRGD
ncbi:glycosyltransferase [Roseivivax marinus]|uniref:rhamnosyltransferase WsaF family glycosyltransferase n=1 Tax=Roseivivax marinus TaxID=1379903 RepID=UPI0015877197|nr:glycosyltransferase [Roseivivax marinus]